jgi:tRNA (mo5U34)-methyltransferase
MTKEEKAKLVNSNPPWMYEFDLGDGLKTPLLAEELRSVHQTRERMVMPLIDKIFSEGLGGKYCLDVACNEGYFSHLLYHRGAKVRGIDIRETNIQRAKAVQHVYGYDPRRLVFQVEDFFNNQDEANTYDLTLFLGLLYHIENPMGALRLLYKITKTLCVIDTQLTRQNVPIISGWGQTSVVKELTAGMALLQEEDMKENNLAAYSSVSFIPNAPAVRQLLFSAGFSQVLHVAAHPSLNQQYVNNDRGVFLALK